MRKTNSIKKNSPPRSGPVMLPNNLINILGPAAVLLVMLAVIPLKAQMEFRGPTASLFSDERLFKVGDVISIVVNERTSGVNNAQFRSQRGAETDVQFGTGAGKVFGMFNPFSGGVSSQNDFDSRVQNNKLTTFTTQVSAMVVRTDELGNLYVEGSKVIELPDEKQVVAISGIVRSRDVTAQNTVESSQVANLQVAYKGKGEAEDARHPSLFNRILGWFF